ncbi:hypothetical protein [Priestia flexa]|uniref:hypothetical protein n=1 Tax=Priestia flexa TaxID=86664 RepID=UPI003CFCA9A5
MRGSLELLLILFIVISLEALAQKVDQLYLSRQSSRRLAINWLVDLSHHRTYGSVYGGSTF